MLKHHFRISLLIIALTFNTVCKCNDSAHLLSIINRKTRINSQYETAVSDLIARIIGDKQDPSNFVIKINDKSSDYELDTFQLEMIDNDLRLQITANSPVAAAWGFNYYLKYFAQSSVVWSGKNINLVQTGLPIVKNRIKITSKDYFRFYQNVCTYSYSFVWWAWPRWEYEIDWMALNGINIVYAQTAAEYAWLKVFSDIGFTQNEVNTFFSGPAFLAWFRMGNIKSYGGYLPQGWHDDQYHLLKKQIERYEELGIKYVLPAFSGFVPDNITRLYPENNFTVASDWLNFECNYSCVLMVNPIDPLFQTIGQAYVRQVTELFGTNHFYSADVFNEMAPKSSDPTYLANINAAIFNSITSVDENASLVMQAWLFFSQSSFWTPPKVEAFLSKIPIGRLILLDLYAETAPQYQRYNSFFGHYYIWSMLHNFGGANGMFGSIDGLNRGPHEARAFVNSSMIGIGLTMEGINQNELMYEFFLEKAWRSEMTDEEISDWVSDFTIRRYGSVEWNHVSPEFHEAWVAIVSTVYNTTDDQWKQLFTKRPSLELVRNDVRNVEDFLSAWDRFIKVAYQYQNSDLLNYDLVDISKEALTLLFAQNYEVLVKAWRSGDLYGFSERSEYLLDLLMDMELLLASDSRFLLGNWINDAKLKATNFNEREMYEWNARTQVTLWGENSTQVLFDYACKAWSGLVEDYYIPRWKIFLNTAEKCLINGEEINEKKLNLKLLVEAELPFVSSRKVYPTQTSGNSFTIAQMLNTKYRT